MGYRQERRLSKDGRSARLGATHRQVVETFRDVWVQGHLDHQRAVEALQQAIRAVERLSWSGADAVDDRDMCRAEQNVQSARRQVAEIEAVLQRQFDHFCGGSR